jgi:Opacity-associated protein A N-terminal motif.
MASDTPSRVPAVLLRVWHLLDNVRWMDPLPAFHRRGIVIALLVLLLAFLWPSSTPQYPIERPADNSSKEVPLQAEIYDNKQPQNATPKSRLPRRMAQLHRGIRSDAGSAIPGQQFTGE